MTSLDEATSNIALLCGRGLRISESAVVITALVLKLTLATAGLVGLYYVRSHDALTKGFHTNVRYLLRLHYFYTYLSMCGTIATDGLDLLRFTFLKWNNEVAANACLVPPMPPTFAVVMKVVKLFGTSGTSLTMFVITIERFFATLDADKYANCSSWFGKLLGLMATIVNISSFVVHVSFADYSVNVYMTTITTGSLKISFDFLLVAVIIEVLLCIGQGLLLGVNFRKRWFPRWIVETLAYKVQIKENLECLKFLVFLSVPHTLFYLSMAIFMPLGANNQESEHRKQVATTVFEFITIHFVVLPIVLYWRNWCKRREVAKIIDVLCLEEPEKRREQERETHFVMMNRMLKGPAH
ncbi:hypothetical protein L596_027009 [Steinernema carpocapsae]|uniref:G-protein coupled receptors family 1 profile domain-containing protein n=1 Tax=Steinernema carpocapsae TaxID=34508 RepID=A0A4U5M338_STECR|nr:hypothetical protein L596_027009 [Steinernema carpocapsae]